MSFRLLPWFLILAFLAVSPASLPAQSNFFSATLPQTEQNCVPSLLADTTAIAPGKPFTIAVRFQLAKGWHLYWQFPGDSGAAPSVRWELPPGFEAGPARWPLPRALTSAGELVTHVYEEELVLPFEIRPPAQLPAGPIVLKASLKWFVCSETCLPGKADVSLELPAGEPAPAHAEDFSKWLALLPLQTDAPFQVSWTRLPDALQIAVRGIPEGEELQIFPIPPAGMTPDHPRVVEPTKPGEMNFKIPVTEADPDGARWRALFVLRSQDGKRRGWELDARPPTEKAAVSSTPQGTPPSPNSGARSTPSSGNGGGPPPTPTPPPPGGLASVLWGAFLGGLLLNLMPCVLPVIALKIFGFTQQAGQDPRKVLKLGIAFTAGVFAFFLGLAAAVIGLKAAGSGLNWGFQFQNPWILVGLISAVFVFGLNLLGVFEITLSSGANARLSQLSGQQGYAGAFAHGLFTTLLGTSCTAPYLGVTLGFAVSQPAPRVVLIFVTIAAGMSLPYLILTTNTSLLRYLPKPGLWMERLKQGMGFLMLGVAVWLLGVLGQSRGTSVMGGACAYLLALGVACWLLGILSSRKIALALALMLGTTGYRLFLHEPMSHPARSTAAAVEGWIPFSPEKLAEERAAGRPVFVDFTAEWCLNCKVNERLTLSKPEVLQAFRERGVTLMVADWTNADPAITAELNRFGRVGVPFYLLYPGGKADPVVFPELLSPSIVLEALQRLPSKSQRP
ncbi:MAG: hypothetical protein RLZZ399_1065 [Verrucomicrobiota bacterium]|jgi:thiol:disulfide interchange protein DsbD